jgi:hypothetical protein
MLTDYRGKESERRERRGRRGRERYGIRLKKFGAGFK